MPNPAHDMVTVTANDVIKETDIYNAIGQPVKKLTPLANHCNISVKELAAGVYTLRIITATGTYSSKLIKQ
jgi:effector-binding domain-containing protein